MTELDPAVLRPATDFGAPGVVSRFGGPFADGPPPEVLVVDTRERYAKALAPDWALARDGYLVKNVFPEAVAKKAADEGLERRD